MLLTAKINPMINTSNLKAKVIDRLAGSDLSVIIPGIRNKDEILFCVRLCS